MRRPCVIERPSEADLLVWPAALGIALCACTLGESNDPQLELRGPALIRVDRLGPVDRPRVMLHNGSEPHGVIWSVSRTGVAEFDGSDVVAVGAGEVRIMGEWEDQRVEWTLVVELATLLSFIDAPAFIRVGQAVDLEVEARRGTEIIDPGAVTWATSDRSVLSVEGGRATGISPGTAYVTARARGAQAMVEMDVPAD